MARCLLSGVTGQSPEGSDEGRRPGQRSAPPRGHQRQSGAALLGETHQEPPDPHSGAPPQTTNGTVSSSIRLSLVLKRNLVFVKS